MARSRELRIEISGDPRSFNRAMGSVARQAGQTESRLARMGRVGAKALLGVGTAAGAGMAYGLKKAIDAAAESEKVMAQTNAVLKSTEGQAKVTAKEVTALATAISRKSGIDDEAVQSAENLLLTFTKIRNETGKGNDVFNQATQAVADMSVALDQDLKNSSIQVGKALNDPIKGITALRRVGVSFSQEQQDMVKGWVEHGKVLKAQKFILKELQTEFGGSAKAAGDTFSGAINKAKNEVGNLGEEVGGNLTPVIEQSTKKFTHFVRQMQSGRGAGGAFAADLKRGFGEAKEEFSDLVDHFKSERRGGASVGSAFASTLSEAFSRAVPKIAEAAAKAAPRAAGAFVKAWVGSSVWGRLILGGWLLKKFGGLGAFRAQGATAGAAFGSGFAAASGAAGSATVLPGLGRGAVPAGAPAGGRVGAMTYGSGYRYGAPTSQLGPRARGLGKLGAGAAALGGRAVGALGGPVGIGITAGFLLGPEIVGAKSRKDAETTGKILEALQAKIEKFKNKPEILRETAKQLRALSKSSHIDDPDALQKLAGDVEKHAKRVKGSLLEIHSNTRGLRDGWVSNIGDIRKYTDRSMTLIERDLGAHSKAGKRELTDNFKAAAFAIKKEMREGSITTKRGGEEMERLLDRHSKAGKRALAGNFGEIVDVIRRTMSKGGKVTDQGAALIERIFKQRLRMFGFSPTEAVNIAQGHNLDGGPNEGGQRYTADQFKAMGGWIGAPGESGRDVVPAMLGRGEAVINRHQQPIVNAGLEAVGVRGGLKELFAKVQKPHYLSQGGMLPGHPELKPGISRLAKIVLNRFPGLSLTATTGGKHAKGSYHYRGQAVDVSGAGMDSAADWISGRYGRFLAEGIHNPNMSIAGGKHVASSYWGASTWADHLDHIHLAVAGGLRGGMWKNIARILVGGKSGPLRAMAQTSLDGLVGAANRRGQSFASGGFGGLDHRFPRHGLSNMAGHAHLTQRQVRAIAETVGFSPGVALQMAQISRGESAGFYPGIVSSDGGYGLWQMTPRTWGAAGIAKMKQLGGLGAMLNPIQNAKMAYYLWKESGFSPWYGTKYLNRNLDRSKVKSVLKGGAFPGMVAAGPGSGRFMAGTGMAHAHEGIAAHGRFSLTGKSRAEEAAWAEYAGLVGGDIGRMVRQFGRTDEDLGTSAGRKARGAELGQILLAQTNVLGAAQAQIAEAKRRIAYHRRQIKILRTRLRSAKGKKVRSDLRKQIRGHQAAIASEKHHIRVDLKGQVADAIEDIRDTQDEMADVSATPNTEDTEAYDWLEGQLGFIDAKVRADDITAEQGHQAKMDLLTKASTDPRLSSGQQLEVRGQLRDESGFVDAASDLAAALKGVQDEMKRQNDFATSVANVTSHEAVRALADVISGQIGGYYSTRSFSPGAGQVVRY